jgi:dipeptidyl aminopeptidase/acylaminoacyl peptidase
LNVVDAATGARVHVPVLPSGVFAGLKWHNDSRHLAITVSTASIPADVFVVDVSANELTRWTYSETGIDASQFSEADLIEWETFDGKAITGFLYRPPARFTGKRPVVMIIHGGPEGQSRPYFLGRWNYFLDELGAALVFPNVRGSSGYGKTFLKLDNGQLREGTYKDIGALIDWIGEQPELDADRIMVYGGSYGGHMMLATAVHYSDRIACAVNLFGISNLRTFLENTEGYRRDLRRVEYGDERDPALRAWMDASAPLTHVERIRKPLFVQQGVNDPRVPKSESDQIVERLTAIGTPAWYLVFDDEGHGWRKKPNADYAFYTTILFAERYLLAAPE